VQNLAEWVKTQTTWLGAEAEMERFYSEEEEKKAACMVFIAKFCLE